MYVCTYVYGACIHKLFRLQPSNVKCNIAMFIPHYIVEYVGNLCSPCPLHEEPKRRIYIYRLCIIQLHVCLTALVLEENILLVTLVHVLSLTMNIYDKSK